MCSMSHYCDATFTSCETVQINHTPVEQALSHSWELFVFIAAFVCFMSVSKFK